MSRVTKIAKKKNGRFQEPIPIGTSSQYITIDDNKTTTLKQVLGDYTKIPNGKISEAIKTLDQRQVVINDASTTEKGLMSSVDFKKINPQVLSKATDDLNEIKTIGWYRIIYDSANSRMLVKNVPSVIQSSCWLEVQQLATGNFFQRLRSTSGLYFERQYAPNTLWSSWKRLDEDMIGATSSRKGTKGYVPAPLIEDQEKFLKGDGTWGVPTNTWLSNTSTRAGYVANPNGAKTKVWKTDSNGNPGWRDQKDTTYSNMTGASSSAAGKAGLVPAPAAGRQNYLLQGNGTWVAPKTTYGGSTSNAYLISGTEIASLDSLTGCSSGRKHCIEFYPPSTVNHGGFIDFHYNGVSSDYTSRIIEDERGEIRISGNFKVSGETNVSTLNVSGITNVNNTLRTQRADSKENGHLVIVSAAATTGLTYMFGTPQKNVLDVYARWGASTGSSVNHISASSSDIRLKKNIKESNVSGLQLINKIPLYEFDWKEDNQHQKIGFVADYLEKIDPNLSIGKETQDKDGNPIYKSVNTFYLQGFEIKAIQELSQQNQELKKEIDSLKKEIKELKEKI